MTILIYSTISKYVTNVYDRQGLVLDYLHTSLNELSK